MKKEIESLSLVILKLVEGQAILDQKIDDLAKSLEDIHREALRMPKMVSTAGGVEFAGPEKVPGEEVEDE